MRGCGVVELLANRDSGSVCIRLFAEGLHSFAVKFKRSVKARSCHAKGSEVATKLAFNGKRQLIHCGEERGLEFESLRYALIIWQLVERVSFELCGDTGKNAWIVIVQTVVKRSFPSQLVMSCPQQCSGEIGHSSQRIKELKRLLMAADYGLSPQAVVLMKGHGYSNCECDQRADGLSPAGRARMLLKPNNKPFHSASLQFLNRIAMVHDWRGDANV